MYADFSIWTFAIVTTALMFAAAELGYQLGQRSKASDSTVGAVKASVLALVGLMLAFSYSIAAGHFDRRVQAIIAEAKSLKACWLQTDFADEPVRMQMREAIKAIVDERAQMIDRTPDAEVDQQSEENLQAQKSALWALASAQLAQSSEPEKHVLLAQSVSNVIDRGGERLAAFADRVPGPVLYLLIAVILTAGFLIGLSSGQDGQRVPMLWTIVIGLLVIVLIMIFDLDTPGRGFIADRYQPLQRLKETISLSQAKLNE